jgi:radical SAM superfamily enzyme YgiQ (UPF0313 family)
VAAALASAVALRSLGGRGFVSADVVLSHGFILDEDEKEQQIMAAYPPLGLLYVAAYLQREGIDVEVVDPTFTTRDHIETRLRQGETAVLGLYTTFMTRASVVRIATVAADIGWTVVIGGPDGAEYAEEYLDHGADVVVVGEGERTMLEILEVVGAKGRGGARKLEGVAGVVFRDESGRVVHNPPRDRIADIDDLPWPARELIDIPAYLEAWRRHHGYGAVNLITARGCAYRCDWCSHTVFGHSHRRRAPAACADEVEWLMATYRPERLWYADDVFNIHHGWLRKFAAELDARGLHAPFETTARADRMTGPEVVETLASLGCERLWIGAESGSQQLLDDMGRGVTPEQVVRAARMAHEHGIEVGLFLMWGYDGERFSDIEATVDMVRRARPDVFLTTVVYPIKGTGYWHKVRDRIVNPKPWAETSDREYRVDGRPGREHYRLADDWLRAAHTEVTTATTDPSEAADLAAETAEARSRLFEERRQLGLEG